MIGSDFSYAGNFLSDFNMAMYDPDNKQQFVGRELDQSEITAIRPMVSGYGAKFTDTLTLDFLIIKSDDSCDTKLDYILSDSEIHAIRSWLEYPKKPSELTVIKSDSELSVHYFGIFSDIQPFFTGEICRGLYLTFTCNAPYGLSDEYTKNIMIPSGYTHVTDTFSTGDSEYAEYLNPKIAIFSWDIFTEGETVSIKNITDENNTMELTMPEGATSIIVDCQKRVITTGDGTLVPMKDVGMNTPISDNYSFINSEAYLFYWLRLLPGENEIEITLSSGHTITNIAIATRYIIKSGGI